MNIVGLTGGIGSGKSTICKVLNDRCGIPIYYADIRAKELMVDDVTVRSQIEALFGDQAYINGVLNRGYISSKVFADKLLLEKLNKAVHNVVKQDFYRWVECHNTPYVVCEAAILIESGWSKELDVVVVVQAPTELRIERVMSRDGATREQVESRILCQLSDEARAKQADVIITADGSRHIEELVDYLHTMILKRISSSLHLS